MKRAYLMLCSEKQRKKIQEVKCQTFALADSSDEDCRAYPFPIFVQMIVCLLNEYIKNLTLIVLRIDCPLLELKWSITEVITRKIFSMKNIIK